MLPAILPLFPLPHVVLFPQTFLPLQIFEPRYREMTIEILDGHHQLVMVLMRDGLEPGSLGQSAPIFEIGCLGKIVRAEPLTGGCWNLLVQGEETVRIIEEIPGKPYRQAHIETLGFETSGLWTGPHRHRLIESLESYAAAEGIAPQLKELLDLPLEDTARLNTLAMALDFEPAERQFLLEAPNLPALADRFLQLLEFARNGRSLDGI